MSELIKPGQALLYMKVGTHAQESLEDIIARKTREIEENGVGYWGYGGGTCHPQTMVQPFGKDYEKRGNVIYLCMQEMESKHFAEPIRADEWSTDGVDWNPFPECIEVLGSRYALVIRNLRQLDFDLILDTTRVALGNSMGAPGNKYIRGRVDKACLEVINDNVDTPEKVVKIGLVADIVAPYAVHVRNRPT
jgi:hypothetical protein